jgi:hypothetical protein
MSHIVVWCPPSQGGSPFDHHQFANRKRFLDNSELSYADLQRMHILRVGDRRAVRRRPTPEWALRDDMVREVLVAYLESRFYVKDRSGTLEDRLARCRAKAEVQLPRKRAKLQEMVSLFRELSRVPETNPSALRSLEREIMNIDTDVFLATKMPEIAGAVVYLYWRLNWNSVSIAEELQLKSPHVRQILYRLNKAYEKMQRLELGKEREVEDRAANLVLRKPQSCFLLNPEAERDGFRPNQSQSAQRPLRALPTIGVPYPDFW